MAVPATEEVFAKQRWTRMAAFRDLVFISLFINLLVLAIPVFVLQVYDWLVFHSGMTTLQGVVIGMGLVIGFDFVLRQARQRRMCMWRGKAF